MTLIYRAHAVQQMAARSISRADVEAVISGGTMIEDYSTAKPFPAALVLGWRGSRPLHVVAAHDSASLTNYVITVYEPDLSRWEPDFKTRRRKP